VSPSSGVSKVPWLYEGVAMAALSTRDQPAVEASSASFPGV
jgi:hypothetical protein